MLSSKQEFIQGWSSVLFWPWLYPLLMDTKEADPALHLTQKMGLVLGL